MCLLWNYVWLKFKSLFPLNYVCFEVCFVFARRKFTEFFTITDHTIVWIFTLFVRTWNWFSTVSWRVSQITVGAQLKPTEVFHSNIFVGLCWWWKNQWKHSDANHLNSTCIMYMVRVYSSCRWIGCSVRYKTMLQVSEWPQQNSVKHTIRNLENIPNHTQYTQWMRLCLLSLYRKNHLLPFFFSHNVMCKQWQ